MITPRWKPSATGSDLPGMSILQFAFGDDPQGPSFRPHNFPRKLVAYTGTHDCDTTVGWWTRPARRKHAQPRGDRAASGNSRAPILNTDGAGNPLGLHPRGLESSVADTVLIPLQDVLGLGSEARMNQPAPLGGNWRWRFRRDMLKPEWALRLKELVIDFDR